MNELAETQTENNAMQEESASAMDALAKIEKEYFAPDELGQAQAALDKVMQICEQIDITPKRNFEPEQEFPAGYGLLILPITKRHESATIVIDICIAAIPDPETIAQSEGGADFIRSTVLASTIAKLANAVRPRSNGAVAASVPYTIDDFITSSRGGESMATYRELASIFVKALKKKGINYMTNVLLRQVLQSASFAEEQLPKFPQTAWENLLDAMIERARKDKLDPAILESWKATRDSVEIEQDEIDLSDFSDLV